MEDVIILGSGCAGLTAAIYTARANLNPLVIEGIQPGGQLTTTSIVENFPGFPEGIDGFELMDNLRKQAKRFGTRITSDSITTVDLKGSIKTLTSDSQTYETKSLIIATGASPRLLGVPGEQELFGGKGVTTCATCDGAFFRDMDVVVIGGGDSACEEALFLTRFCPNVTLIHRRDQLRASSIMSERTLSHKQIQPLWDSVVEAVHGVKEDAVSGIQVKNVKTGESSTLPCKGVFVAIGHIPNTQPFAEFLKLDDQGYILPETGSMVKTNVQGVYASGDCVDHVYRQAITAAGMGCQAAIETERWLSENTAQDAPLTATPSP